MPLPKRAVAPVHVARSVLPAHLPVPNELEAVTNGTLANTVRQLSSLSRHAEDLFGELAREAGGLAARAQLLQARLDRLSTKVQNLDSNVEEVTLLDIQMRKAFKSSTQFDQQIFSRATMPTAMLETYASCERPPPLDKLNPYRDDGRDGLKFYTDPGYFFELWRQEMLQDTERIQHDRGKKMRPRGGGGGGADAARRKQRVRAPPCTREKQRQRALIRGEHLMPQTTPANHYAAGDTANYAPQHTPGGGIMMVDGAMGEGTVAARPSSIELSRQYQPHQPQAHQPHHPTPTNNINSHGDEPMYGTGPLSSESLYSGSIGGGGTPRRSRPSGPPPAPPGPSTPTRRSTPARDTLPPPPPPPASPPAVAPPPPASPPAPPPPPPPPPQGALTPPPPPPPAPVPALANGDARSPLLLKQTLKAAPPPPEPLPDPRNDLLKAIRDGIKLRKVEKTNNGRSDSTIGSSTALQYDVASILARRVAVEFSESDSGSDSEADSDGWAEPPPA